MPILTDADLDQLSRPHVQRGFFAELQLPSGLRRLHTGLGTVTIGGFEWQGVGDPFGGQLVGIGAIEEPEFGQAPAIDIIMSGASRAFLKSMWDGRFSIEGARCDISFATFDAESGQVLVQLTKLFPGRITSPEFVMQGANVRFIKLKVISLWEGLNFPTTKSRWSPTGQRERFPGDAGLDLIGAEIIEEYRP
jgi:hypothetical protein